jgi:hypothetical protein
MVMVGQAKRLSEPTGWGPREWRILAATVAVIVVGSIAAALATSGGKSSADSGRCVSVSFASTTGAASLHQCGAAARAWCEQILGPSTARTALNEEVAAACRAQGFTARRPAAT